MPYPPLANMESEHDLEMHREDGGEKLEYPENLQQCFTSVQGPSITLSNKPQWQSDGNNSKDIRSDNIVNHNCTGRAVLLIHDELLSAKEQREEKKEEKKEKKEAITKEIHEAKDISTSTPKSISELDAYSRASSKLHETSNIGELILEDQSPKNNSSLLWSISDSSKQRRQNSLGHDSTGQRFVPIPERSERSDNAKNGELGIRELRGSEPLDSSGQIEAQDSDQNAHNRCANEKKEAILSKLQDLPDYLREQLNKNNHLEFHQITEKDSLDFVDLEYKNYLNEKFGIIGVQPIFIDHSGYVIWILDEVGHMYEWDEMQQSLRYLGKDLIKGLTNIFICPDNICEVMEDTGERVPVEKFRRRMKEKAKRIWDERIIL